MTQLVLHIHNKLNKLIIKDSSSRAAGVDPGMDDHVADPLLTSSTGLVMTEKKSNLPPTWGRVITYILYF